MCSAEAAMAPGAAYGQYQQGKTNQSYYNYLADSTKLQAEESDAVADMQIANVSKDSAKQLQDLDTNFNQTTADQKAAMAANGVNSDSGTYSDIMADSIDKQTLDEAAVKFNADEAMYQIRRNKINQRLGYATEASNYRLQGSNARATGNLNAANTLVSGAASGSLAGIRMNADAKKNNKK